MTKNTLITIRKNPNYVRYLREHSYWYKLLNRNPDNLNKFVEEVKENYKLRTVDKIEKFTSMIDLASKLMETMK